MFPPLLKGRWLEGTEGLFQDNHPRRRLRPVIAVCVTAKLHLNETINMHIIP